MSPPSSSQDDVVDRDATDSVKLLKSLLGQAMRIKIVDERTFEGQFVCVDKPINIVLDRAVERLPGLPPREVGLIMIPFDCIVSVEARPTAHTL